MTNSNVVQLRKTDPLNRQLRIAVGKPGSGFGKAKNVLTTWGKFLEKLKTPARDNITIEQYEKLSKDQKLQAKNKGYYISGQFEGERRKNNHAQQKILLTFDVDFGDARTAAEFEMGENWLGDFEYVMHTTRSHKIEVPKFRVSIPLDRSLPPDEWMAVSRIVASKIDPEMAIFDQVSFRAAQLMFWPSINTDSAYSFYHNATGRFLSGQEILADWPGWEDISQLPRRQSEDLTHAGKPVADPHDKEGVIGAFCRAYTISEVIETWLSDIYEEAQGDDFTGTRYTYKLGSSFGGVRVYDDKLLWSDHATDPAGGHQQNAFDLLRIHKFGDLDTQDEDGDDSKVGNRPSFKAMRKFAMADEETRSQMAAAQYDAADILDDMSEEAEEDEAPPEDSISDADAETAWMGRIDLTTQGEYRSTLHNVMLVLRHDKRFKDLIGFNELAQKVVIRRRWRAKYHKIDYPTPHADGAEWTDIMSAQARSIFDSPKGKGPNGFGMFVGKDLMDSAIDMIANENRFHPVRAYLNGLTWDRTPRVRTMFSRFLGAEDTSYTREVARLMMLAAVARAMAPGCKFDYVVILEGEQGIRKSTFLRTLTGSRWFGELRGDYGDPKKLDELISGHWIMEIPDLAHFNKHDAAVMKALFSAQQDRVRRSYARRSETYLRHVIFTATTNEKQYLDDPTGNRRYWPVFCAVKSINIAGLKAERDQLWAEATAMFREMAAETDPEDDYPLYISDEEASEEAQSKQAEREVDEGFTALAERIHRWLDTPVSPTAAQPGYDAGADFEDAAEQKVYRMLTVPADIFRYAMHGDINHYTKAVIKKIGAAMKLLARSWLRMPQSRSIIEGKKVLYYKRITPVPGDDADDI